MSLSAGTRLGPYEVADQLGAGGMGEVYRATDTRLDRTVAIKVLPEHLADDPQRRERFEREARAVSSLNHPHICTLHDIGEQDGIHYLVMEYVEGDTLQQRLEKGRLPLDQALEYAIQIADALDKAHRQGVVHRDLKPGNIMLTKSGTKLLDFGLAKLKGDAADVSPLSQMPTQDAAAPLTAEGTILGTLQYMAPEQLEGREADARTDIFAFGAVVYELVTSKKAFEGASQASLIAAIIEREAQPLNQFQPRIPRALDRVVRRCLAKDPDERWQSAYDLMHEVKWIADDPTSAGETSTAQSTPPGPDRRVVISSVAVLTLIAIVVVMVALVPRSSAPKMILEITTPPTTEPGSVAVSPDGGKIVFVATSEGETRLWLRRLESGSAEPLPRTANPSLPFWSPDSRSIGFFADQKLKRIDIDPVVVRELADAPVGSGGSWNSDDVIVFAPTISGALFRIPAVGGEPVQVTQQAGRTASHINPNFLPDGQHFLYRTGNAIYVTNFEGLEPRLLLDTSGPVDFHAPSGQLLFTRQGVLFAQPFDLTRLELGGEPEPVAEGLQAIALSASAAGPIVYRGGRGSEDRQMVWFDQSGREIERVGNPIDDANAPTISPDQSIVAFQYRPTEGPFDIGLLDMDTGLLDNLTFSAEGDLFPVWSPSGGSVAFGAAHSGAFDLYEQSTAGGEAQLLFRSELNKLPMDWTVDGRFLLYRSLDPTAGYDLWALRMDGSGETFPVVQTDADDRDGQFSPDGSWIAYQSNQSGQFEIYLQPFPGPGRSRQISPNGGTQVRWRADGRELFYIGLDGWLMAVPFNVPSGNDVEPGRPVALFPTKVGGALQGVMPQQYAVSPDGDRFLMNLFLESDGTEPITVILNWRPGTGE